MLITKDSDLEYKYDDATAYEEGYQFLSRINVRAKTLLITNDAFSKTRSKSNVIFLGRQKPLFRQIRTTHAFIELELFLKLKDTFSYLLSRYEGDKEDPFYQWLVCVLNKDDLNDGIHVLMCLLKLVINSERAERVVEALHEYVVEAYGAGIPVLDAEHATDQLSQKLYPQYNAVSIYILTELVKGDNLSSYLKSQDLNLTKEELHGVLTETTVFYYPSIYTILNNLMGYLFYKNLQSYFVEYGYPSGYIDGDQFTLANPWHSIPTLRSFKVYRWIEYCVKNGRIGAIEKERSVLFKNVIKDGQVVRKPRSLLAVSDEIMKSDIIHPKVSVQKVCELIGERNLKAQDRYLNDHTELHPITDWMKALPNSITVLNTPHQLVMEGLEMDHCVGGYVEAVKDGDIFILSINDNNGRSTVEVNGWYHVNQHEGFSGEDPPEAHVELLTETLAAVVKKQRIHP